MNPFMTTAGTTKFLGFVAGAFLVAVCAVWGFVDILAIVLG